MLCTVVRDLISFGHDFGGFFVNMQLCFGLSNSFDCTLGCMLCLS